jgi:hypothetical protein
MIKTIGFVVTIIFYLLVFQDKLTLGTYTSKIKKQTHTIILKYDSSYVYHKGTYGYSFGRWFTKNDSLILYSPILTNQDSMTIALSGGSYFKINRMVLLIRDKTLVDVKNKKKFLVKE